MRYSVFFFCLSGTLFLTLLPNGFSDSVSGPERSTGSLDYYREIMEYHLCEQVVPFWVHESLDEEYGGYVAFFDELLDSNRHAG